MTRSRIFLILAAFSILISAEFGDAGGPGVVGVSVTRPVPSAAESVRDVQARAPGRQSVSPPTNRLIPFRKIRREAETGPIAPGLSLSLSPAAPLPFAPASLAPALSLSFAGLSNPTAGDVIPPDTMGAVGPNHLVSLLNSQFGVFDKTTGLIPGTVVTIENFWGSLGTGAGEPANNPFDPKVLYDSASGRFVAAAIGGHVVAPSWILLAMSATSDPTGAWFKVAIRADVDADNVVRQNGADYTCLGVDAANIYVAANMFDNTSNFQYSKVWVVSKSEPLLNGGGVALTWTEFRNPAGRNRDGINAFAMQPANTFGTAPAEYFIFEDGSGFLRLSSITSSAGTLTWNNLGSIQVTSFSSLSATPDAPQQGDTRGINTSDTRLLKAVYRNGSVWTTHHVSGTGGKTEVAWYQINPAAVSVAQQGRISDPDRWYYYPSIAVNKDNDVAIGFSGSSAGEFASGWYTTRKGDDPNGTMLTPSLLKAGEAAYFKTLGGSENRFGDFSATAVDPADDVTFWTLQEYAKSPQVVSGSLRAMWGTWWGKFPPPSSVTPPPSPPVSSGGGGGGGCAIAGPAGQADPLSSGMALLLLFLPACALAARRRINRRRRAASGTPFPARPGAP